MPEATIKTWPYRIEAHHGIALVVAMEGGFATEQEAYVRLEELDRSPFRPPCQLVISRGKITHA